MGRGRSKLKKNNNASAETREETRAAGASEAKSAEDIIAESKSSAPAKTFDATPIDEWDYGRDYRDTEAFFKSASNYDTLIGEMSDSERRDFMKWCGGHFMDGSQYKGFDKMDKEDQRLTRTYDKYLDRTVLTQSVELRRLATPELVLGKGKKTCTLAELQAMEGSVVTSKGSMSTAAAAEGLGIGSKSTKPVEYKITIAGGSKGAGMWIGDGRINHWEGRQREFMTNRDSIYRVGKTTYDKKRDKFITEIEFVGVGEHDYGKKGK